ncbi:phospho-N-acetylmuramoyl-pentapeptide-transferase [soil metagenome]
MRGILFASSAALLISLLGTPFAIRLFQRRGYGQLIREDGPTTHHIKRGTPTMGGAVIIVATVVAYGFAHVATWTIPSVSGVLVLFLMTGLGTVGFLDDWIKISKQRSMGLRSGAKVIGQSIVGITFAVLALQFPDPTGLTPGSEYLSFVRDTAFYLTPPLFVLWAFLMIAATSNGVNLTDGLDGLATGTSVMVAGAYVLVGVFQFGQRCGIVFDSQCYEVRDPLDLAVVAAALMGSCFGFLWWNAAPARIFMGDTGSLAIGGALAGLAITSRTQVLLLLFGGLFAIITLSVILQVGSFRLTGKRMFRMAPLQHHFEVVGWHEVTIVVRFWIIAGLCVAVGLGAFYGEWVTG